MTNSTDTNQASEALEAKLNTIIFARFYDIPDKQRSTVVKNLRKLIRTEKLKLLEAVREQVVGEDEKLHYINADADPDDYLVSERKARNALRAEQLEMITKLEAEL